MKSYFVGWGKTGSLRAEFLVWDLVLHAGNSKPESLLARFNKLSLDFSLSLDFLLTDWHIYQKTMESICNVVLRAANKIFNKIHGSSVEGRPVAYEQDFWFGISRFIGETLSHRVCLLGRPLMWPLFSTPANTNKRLWNLQYSYTRFTSTRLKPKCT